LLKERSEVSGIVKLFFNKIKNQFSTSIHMLHIENALEYVKNDVSIFCSRMRLFIKLLALTHPNKMVSLNANIDIF